MGRHAEPPEFPRHWTQSIHALNQQMNAEVRSAGMVCFDMKNGDAQHTVTKLLEKKIIASTTPYAVPIARLAFGIMNTSDEVERTARALRSI